MKSKKTTTEIISWYDEKLKNKLKNNVFYINELSLGEDIVNNELKEHITKSFSVFDVRKYQNGLLILLCGLGVAIHFVDNQIKFYLHNACKDNLKIQNVEEKIALWLL